MQRALATVWPEYGIRITGTYLAQVSDPVTGKVLDWRDQKFRMAIGRWAIGHSWAFLRDGAHPGVIGEHMYASILTRYPKGGHHTPPHGANQLRWRDAVRCATIPAPGSLHPEGGGNPALFRVPSISPAAASLADDHLQQGAETNRHARFNRNVLRVTGSRPSAK